MASEQISKKSEEVDYLVPLSLFLNTFPGQYYCCQFSNKSEIWFPFSVSVSEEKNFLGNITVVNKFPFTVSVPDSADSWKNVSVEFYPTNQSRNICKLS